MSENEEHPGRWPSDDEVTKACSELMEKEIGEDNQCCRIAWWVALDWLRKWKEENDRA